MDGLKVVMMGGVALSMVDGIRQKKMTSECHFTGEAWSSLCYGPTRFFGVGLMTCSLWNMKLGMAFGVYKPKNAALRRDDRVECARSDSRALKKMTS